MNVILKMSQVDSKKDNGDKNHHHRISQYAIVAHLSAPSCDICYIFHVLSRLFILVGWKRGSATRTCFLWVRFLQGTIWLPSWIESAAVILLIVYLSEVNYLLDKLGCNRDLNTVLCCNRNREQWADCVTAIQKPHEHRPSYLNKWTRDILYFFYSKFSNTLHQSR